MRPIPGTNLVVSPICLGTMTFGTPVAEPQAIRLVHYARSRGINFIDTANMYEGYARRPGSAGGVAEEILGKALRDRRSEYVVATKLGMKVGQAPEDEYTSPAAINKHLGLSLRRLATDHVDILYLHKPDPTTPLADILGQLEREMTAGRIRAYGVSNYGAAQLVELLRVADDSRLPRPVVCQPPLSLLRQDALKDLVPICARERIAVVPYQILQGGLLTGKYRPGSPPPRGSRAAENADWLGEPTVEQTARLDEISRDAAREGIGMTTYAIRWALRQPGVCSALVGVKNEIQIDAALTAAAVG